MLLLCQSAHALGTLAVMADVFLLGAGFSKAIAKTMPTMAQLFARLEPLIGTADGLTKDAFEYADGNVETLLSYYAVPSPHDDRLEVLSKRHATALLEVEIGKVLQECEEEAAQLGLNARGVELVSRWHKQQSHVLTTNYDTLVERLLFEWTKSGSEMIPNKPSPDDIHPIAITSALSRDGAGLWGSSHPDTLTLYKLHGSTNWFRSSSEVTADPIFSLSPFQVGNPKVQKFISDKQRFIVPPVYDKSSLLAHDSVRSLWWQAKAKALGQADNLYVIGYSLPDTDAAMHTLLWEGRRANPEVGRIPLYVVDVSAEVARRYTKKLGNYYDVQVRYAGVDDAFDKFVDAYTTGK